MISVSQNRESKAKKYLTALTCISFLMTTGNYITNIAFPFVLFNWVKEAVTENMLPLQHRLSVAEAVSAPYDVAAGVFDSMAVS